MIFWRMLVILVPIDFLSIYFPAVKANGDQQLFASSKYFKISSLVFNINTQSMLMLIKSQSIWRLSFYASHLKDDLLIEVPQKTF